MKEMTIADGFQCHVDETLLDDMELFEDIIALDKSDMTVLPTIITKLLGSEQKKALYEHLRGDNGRIAIAAVAAAVKDIFTNFSASEKK